MKRPNPLLLISKHPCSHLFIRMRSNRLFQSIAGATLIVVALALTMIPGLLQSAGACTFAYPVWRKNIRSDTPLFRFAIDGKAGYIDASGRIVIPPRFRHTDNYGGDFFEGLARVTIDNDKTGLIDRTGQVVDLNGILPGDFSEGRAVYWENAEKNNTGARSQRLAGYIDREGNKVIPAQFDSASEFSGGLAAVTVNKRIGYIDLQGKMVIEPRFLHGAAFSDGAAKVIDGAPCRFVRYSSCDRYPSELPMPSEGGERRERPQRFCKFSFIDEQGRPLFERNFENAHNFSEGLSAVKEGQFWGYVDKQGNMQIPFQFQYARPFSEGLASVSVHGIWGFIDRHGTFIIPPRFSSANSFSDGLAVVSEKSGGADIGNIFIDPTGKQAVPGSFLNASSFVRGLAHVQFSNWRHAYINRSGRAVFTYYEVNDLK